MKIYGMTGGIASGKSEVARRLIERGIPVIDADTIAHEVMEPGGAAYDAVIDAFGREILNGGQIDRDKLGAIVFNDSAARERLNGLVHPAVVSEIGNRCTRYAQDGAPCVVVDAALLGDDGQPVDWISGLILVLSPAELRVERMVTHRGLTREDAQARLDAQVPPENKRPLATWVIENTGTLEALREEADQVAEAVLKDAVS